MTTALRIRNWDKHYETNKTRPLRTLSWIALPVALDSDGYAEVMEHENGASHFGIFIAILEVAARCVPRGCLLRARQVPHDARSLSRMCRIPAPMVQEALDRLLSIGWIETWHLEDTIEADKCREKDDTLHNPTGITLPVRPVGSTVPGLQTSPTEQGGDGNGKGNPAEATPNPPKGGSPSPSEIRTEQLRRRAKQILAKGEQ